MASITYWNRLEPRPRATDLANALAARVRDPAWFLARQWQLGEFRGADGGSPAYLKITAQTASMTGWSPDAANAGHSAIDGATPLEPVTATEGVSPDDLALAVQIGQSLDRILRELSAQDLRPAFLEGYPIAAASTVDDPRAKRLRALWRGRAIDGLALYGASQRPRVTGQPPPGVPASVPSGRWSVASTAVSRVVAWVRSVVGDISAADPAAWRPQQLDYAVRVYTTDPATASAVALQATPDRHGDLAWYAFDASAAPTTNAASAPNVTTLQRAVIPGPVRFRGMPNERFWDFEDGRVDFGGLTPDRRGIAALLLADFMLVHGNDWFLAPFEMPVGSVCCSALTMVDVFGESVDIPRADAASVATQWTMFSTSTDTGATAGFFALPATAAGTVLDGPALEQVRFLRDDTSAIAWAVERTIESSLGIPWIAVDRLPPAPPPPTTSGLAYRIASQVPANWIPFVPVKLAATGEVVLERASLLSLDTDVTLPVRLGRILEPTSRASGSRYSLREEMIPREGVQVVRRARYARGADGASYVWVSRARSVGEGEGWSGLRFDLATVE